MQNNLFDIIIIGGGVVGSMIARFLSRYELRILLIEKEADLGMGASSANTAIIHAGYDPVPGSLKAKLNVRGNALFEQLSQELGFAFERSGDMVVAIGEEEWPNLLALYEMGIQNGVPDMRLFDAGEVKRREPKINPSAIGALWAGTTGIVDPFQATIAAAENAVMNGATVLLNTRFEDFIIEDARIKGIKTNRGNFRARWIINVAGIHADAVMHLANSNPTFKITPRRGEYYVFDPADVQINNVLFPVPSAKGKGILVTTTVHGNTMAGPNAQIIADKEDTATTAEGMAEVVSGAQKLVPSINPRYTIATFAGLRAMGNAPCKTPGVDYHADFLIEIEPDIQGLINVAGIESPGLSASPAIAEYVVELLKEAGETLKEKSDFNPIRPARPRFRTLSHAERQVLVQTDPAYARVICRCENITEAEIVREIHAPIPATTYDAIKRRTWLGTGRCQGGFDMPLVTRILARELDISELEVSKRGEGSRFLFRQSKDSQESDHEA